MRSTLRTAYSANSAIPSGVAAYCENTVPAGLGGRVLGRELDLEAELLEAADQPLLDAVAVAFVEVVPAQLLVGCLPHEQIVDTAENTVPDRNRRLLLPQPGDQAMILGGEIAVRLAGRGLARFDQRGAQPHAALARLALLPFAGTLVVARTHPRPRVQMLGAREAAQVGADLREQHLGGDPPDARDGVQALNGRLQRAQALRDLGAHLLERLVQKVDVRQLAGEQEMLVQPGTA